MLSAQKLVSWLPHKLIALAAVAGLMAGLVTTRVVLSVATITLACNALLHEHVHAHFRLWLKNRNAMLFLGYFLICALSGFYSENMHAWWSSTQNKLPLLAIPFGWTVIHKDLQAYSRALLYAFVMIISVAAAAVLINYFLHYETLNASIKLGSAIPTPMMDHIRFSLETALAALLCLHLLLTGKQFRWLLVLLFLLLGTTLHFLAVRSGLLAFYGGLLLMGLYQLFSGRNRKLGTITLLAGIVIGVMALRFIPSLHNKVLYFNYEWSLIEQGELKAGHSDAQRVQSILYGWEVARQNFPLGVGTGDLRDVMDAEYLQHPDTASIKPERPHNQFVYTLAAIGLAGFVLLLLAFFYPLSDKTSMKAWLMPAYLFIVLISFMTEHVLEIQIGMAFIMLFNHLLPEAFRKKEIIW